MTGNSHSQSGHTIFIQCMTLACGFMLAFTGCAEETEPEAKTRIVTIDSESGEVVLITSGDDFPAVHPRTGDRTLMPALYCPSCKEWKQIESLERVQRGLDSALCPIDGKTEMSLDGPLPE